MRSSSMSAAFRPTSGSDIGAVQHQNYGITSPSGGLHATVGTAFADLIRDLLSADNDPRTVVGEEHARYFGTELTDASITAGPDARLGATTFAEWLAVNHK